MSSTAPSRPRRGRVLSHLVLLAAILVSSGADARSVTPRGALTPEERTLIDMFEQAKRSVVYISTTERVRDLWTRNVRSLPKGTGSGIFWDDQGDILTNHHVIAGASEARVRLNDGRDYPATLVGVSLGVVRGGKRITVEATLAAGP